MERAYHAAVAAYLEAWQRSEATTSRLRGLVEQWLTEAATRPPMTSADLRRCAKALAAALKEPTA